MTRSNPEPEVREIRDELRRIIGDAMGVDASGVQDDVPLIEYVSSSLALVTGMREVFERFGVLVPVRRVFEGDANLTALAMYIAQALQAENGTPASQEAHGGHGAALARHEIPLAPSQRHEGFLLRYSSGAGAAYNEALALRLEGLLRVDALSAALHVVSDRYEALRMALASDKDVLHLLQGERMALAVADCPAHELPQRLQSLVTRPFNPDERLFRLELLRVSESDHVLALVGHALLVDHAALKTVLHDLAAVYRAVAGVDTQDPPSVGVQWSEYALRRDKTGHRDADVAHWQACFAEGVPQLDLPTTHPRPAVKNYAGARWTVPVEPSLETALDAWAVSQGIDPDTVWMGAFAALLHRLTRQEQVVIGLAHRMAGTQPAEKIVARTWDTTPVCSRYDGDATFAGHMKAFAESVHESLAHASLSKAELVQALQIPRDQSRAPLFSAAFRVEDTTSPPDFGTMKTSYAATPSAGARYDIEVIRAKSDHGHQLCCEYSTELLDDDTVSRWLYGLLEFLRRGLQDPGRAVCQLPVVTERERGTLLLDWNATDKAYPKDRTTLDLILEQIEAHAERPAVRSGATTLTYAQLGTRIDQIAGMLLARGVKPGDRVGVFLARTPDLVATLAAVWRVGAAYVPLDLQFPQQRLAFMLADAEVRLLVTMRKALARFEDAEIPPVLCLDEWGDDAASLPKPSCKADSACDAYVIYTSGSTGRPKGVQVGHRSLTNFLVASRALLEFDHSDALLAISSVSFDISCLELFVPLIAGGVVEMGEDGLAADGIRLAERLETLRPSYVQATPSTWKTVLAAGWKGDPHLCILSAGEAISRELAEQLLPKGGALWNLYGPTETTVYSTAYRVESAPGEPMRIGRPYPNTSIYILDDRLQLVPVGAVGDLYIGGDGLAVGYWKRPELTAQRFIPNPFRPGERMYKTGDLARYTPEGDIICLGRLDDQVKIHGVRCELGEVEMALRAVTGVRDAVVTSWKDPSGDLQLVAHVIPEETQCPGPAELRARLRETLPEPMVPPHIVFTQSFPLTANGKIQRAALPSPAVDEVPAKATGAPPSTVTERRLAEAWSRVLNLGVERIGRDDEFLNLGGHSLLMTRLMLEVRKLFHVNLGIREFFDAPTLRQFAARVDEAMRARSQGANGGTSTVPLRDSEWGKQRMAFLKREADLPAGLAPARGLVYEPPDAFRTVLLTGATGFLGAYITAQMLQATEADVYCLVRPQLGVSGKSRIEAQMRAYDVWRDDEAWRDAWERRVHVVEGDVILPRLGMADAAYESLALDLDCIIHSAAHVNFIYPYEALRATNVLGVHEIIRFAFYKRIKPVHYLSTAAIWPMGSQYTFYEKDPIDHGRLLNLGYDEAKWVGERCLVNAAERGLPVARYRPGEVGGDSQTGRCVLSHFIVAAFKGFLQLGIFPAIDTRLDVAPVDYVAKALVHMVFRGNPLGRAFHLTNPQCCSMSEALAFLRGMGYHFEVLPFPDLRERLIQDSAFSANALFPYQAALDDMDAQSLQFPVYDCRQTLRELESSGISCPPVDARLLGTYWRYLKSVDFIPEPERTALAAGA